MNGEVLCTCMNIFMLSLEPKQLCHAGHMKSVVWGSSEGLFSNSCVCACLPSLTLWCPPLCPSFIVRRCNDFCRYFFVIEVRRRQCAEAATERLSAMASVQAQQAGMTSVQLAAAPAVAKAPAPGAVDKSVAGGNGLPQAADPPETNKCIM